MISVYSFCRKHERNLLQFEVACNCCSQQNLFVTANVYRDHKKATAGANNLGPGRQFAFGDRSQVMNCQVCGRHAFARLEPRGHGESRSRINYRGHDAAMNNTLVLLQFITNFEVDRRFAGFYFAKFQSQKFA